jgi:SET domain-containing protein
MPLPCRVARSRTGLGLFATELIKRGTTIAEYTGHRIPTRTARELERTRGLRYMMEVNSRWTIDGSPRSNIARYVNHACKPNAEAVTDRGRVFLRALRRIEAGEEITCDYGRSYFDLFFAKSGCRCATCEPRDGAS